MNSTFLLSGGAGRIITAIPALEKYARLNPDDDFKVVIHGWENLFWSHPLLQQRTFGIGQKGIFDLIIKNSILKVPEPYHCWSYYNQKTSLAEAFDEEINKTNDHSDLSKPNLYVHSNETVSAIKLINEAKKQKGKSRFIVYQPYGSGTTLTETGPVDLSGRSLTSSDANELGKMLAKDAVVLYFGPNDFVHPNDDFMLNSKGIPGADLRFFMSMISLCDMFVGVDSVGQHLARAFNKPGVVIMGSTFEKNVSYPDKFSFYRNKNVSITYNPIRIGGVDCEMADRLNDGVMKLTSVELGEIYKMVKAL